MTPGLRRLAQPESQRVDVNRRNPHDDRIGGKIRGPKWIPETKPNNINLVHESTPMWSGEAG
jgi:hypothetical protein